MSNNTATTWEDELEAIREQLYEETKDMTPEEWASYSNAQAEPIMKQYNLKWATLKPVEPYHPREWQNVAAIYNS